MHTCEFTNGFLTHIVEEKTMILHPCEPKYVFSIHIREEKKWYCTFMGPQVILKNSYNWRRKMILHICELVSGWEVVFSIHMGEEKKW